MAKLIASRGAFDISSPGPTQGSLPCPRRIPMIRGRFRSSS